MEKSELIGILNHMVESTKDGMILASKLAYKLAELSIKLGENN